MGYYFHKILNCIANGGFYVLFSLYVLIKDTLGGIKDTLGGILFSHTSIKMVFVTVTLDRCLLNVCAGCFGKRYLTNCRQT